MTLSMVLQREPDFDAASAHGPGARHVRRCACVCGRTRRQRAGRHSRRPSCAGGRVRDRRAADDGGGYVARRPVDTGRGVPPCGSRGSGGVRSRRWRRLDALASDARGRVSGRTVSHNAAGRPALRRPRESRVGRFACKARSWRTRRRAAADSSSTYEPSMASSPRRLRGPTGPPIRSSRPTGSGSAFSRRES